ncbi:Ubiquitin carboxyl-terminal hydrolase 48 [Heterocephalus glaber]|uniref:Ubiquitin carboxyl-terminal hydrolase 48 n=1 Tax=Heterocephalus glaber TaxID=10181 RepID=G5BGZ2_HETGA|nr:Ubiquitin carboxyl-terminal hydrolase 48 [Heterocephalus glaber]
MELSCVGHHQPRPPTWPPRSRAAQVRATQKAAWRWEETVPPEEVSQEHIETAYRIWLEPCIRGICRQGQQTGHKKKLNTYIGFSEILDMEPYVEHKDEQDSDADQSNGKMNGNTFSEDESKEERKKEEEELNFNEDILCPQGELEGLLCQQQRDLQEYTQATIYVHKAVDNKKVMKDLAPELNVSSSETEEDKEEAKPDGEKDPDFNQSNGETKWQKISHQNYIAYQKQVIR